MHSLLALALLAAVPALRYEERSVERKLPGCGDAKNGCAHVELKYVEVTSGPLPVRAEINAAIVDWLVSKPSAARSSTPEEYADSFIAAYPKELKQRWSVARTVKVVRSTPPVFTVLCEERSYTGGAHGSLASYYLNFDPVSGDKVILTSVLREGALRRLNKIAEVHFRRKRKLAPEADLKEAGFIFLREGRFQINQNFGFGEKALLFFFNPYEIAPWSMGATEVAIPYGEIRDLFAEDFQPAP